MHRPEEILEAEVRIFNGTAFIWLEKEWIKLANESIQKSSFYSLLLKECSSCEALYAIEDRKCPICKKDAD